MLNIIKLKKEYMKWLNNNIIINHLNQNMIQISVPFFDNFNDEIAIYAIQKKSNLFFTDDGWTLDNLKSLGVTLEKNSFKWKLIKSRLNAYSIYVTRYNELMLKSNVSNFVESVHDFLQAMLFVNDMFVFAPRRSRNIFVDNMDDYLGRNHIRAVKNFSVKGISGLTQVYDFVIPSRKSKKSTNKYIKTISEANSSLYAGAAFAAVAETRPKLPIGTYKFYVFLNDIDKNHKPIKVKKGILNLFRDHSIKPCLFSQRYKYVKELLA